MGFNECDPVVLLAAVVNVPHSDCQLAKQAILKMDSALESSEMILEATLGEEAGSSMQCVSHTCYGARKVALFMRSRSHFG